LVAVSHHQIILYLKPLLSLRFSVSLLFAQYQPVQSICIATKPPGTCPRNCGSDRL